MSPATAPNGPSSFPSRHRQPDRSTGPRAPLTSGNYRIVKQGDGVLTAYPASSLAVAMYDQEAAVGGIIHLILPKPVGRSSLRQPTHYASSGLPLFIDKLLEAGAQRHRLQAAIAGGAPLGYDASAPASAKLSHLLTDQATAFLEQEGIPVVDNESGGAFPVSLHLDSNTWQTAIRKAAGATPHTVTHTSKPSVEDLDQAIAAVRPLPKVALEVMDLLGREEISANALLSAIAQDQVIAAKVLRFSNSPLLGCGKEVTSLERAIVLLGEKNLLEIVVTAAAETTLTASDQAGYSLRAGGLFRHALAAAHAAKEIATFSGWVNPETAYTAALLHDIGKLVLASFVPMLFPLYSRIAADRLDDLSLLEKRTLGIDHLAAGKRLADLWQLPAPLREAITYHHWPEEAPAANTLLVHTIYLADLLATSYLGGMEVERINSGLLLERLEVLGLRLSHLAQIIDNIPWPKVTALP